MRKILGRGGRGKEGHARGKRQRRERARTDGKASGAITKEFGGSEHFQETSYSKTRKKLGEGKIGCVLTRRIHNRTSLSTELLQQFRIAPLPPLRGNFSGAQWRWDVPLDSASSSYVGCFHVEEEEFSLLMLTGIWNAQFSKQVSHRMIPGFPEGSLQRACHLPGP